MTRPNEQRGAGLVPAWCETRGAACLPAAPETVADYLDTMIETLSAATLSRRPAAIVRVHRLLVLPNPADAELVRLALRRIKRRRPNRPHQAHGIDRDLRAQMLGACGDNLSGKRDKVLVALGFEGLCRRSEIAVLIVADLAVLVRRGKADQNGEGRLVTLSTATAKIVLDLGRRGWARNQTAFPSGLRRPARVPAPGRLFDFPAPQADRPPCRAARGANQSALMLCKSPAILATAWIRCGARRWTRRCTVGSHHVGSHR